MQILRCMIHIWEDYEKEMKKRYTHISERKDFRYPPVFPIVYYEGANRLFIDNSLVTQTHKINVRFPMNMIIHRYGSICEPDLIDAFHTCGITVIEDCSEINSKNISPEERIRSFGELLLTSQAAFAFSVNFFPYISEICEKLHVPYVSLSVDCPVLELFSVSIRNRCNRIFL